MDVDVYLVVRGMEEIDAIPWEKAFGMQAKAARRRRQYGTRDVLRRGERWWELGNEDGRRRKMRKEVRKRDGQNSGNPDRGLGEHHAVAQLSNLLLRTMLFVFVKTKRGSA